jgi:hypothetical protein
MKAQKFEEFVSSFNAATAKFPILLAEQLVSSPSEEKVFKTLPTGRASMMLTMQGRQPGTKPLAHAMVFDFQAFEKSARVGISVGRTETSKICLPDNAISKMHASFKMNSSEQWELVDVESANSTRVNGKMAAPNKNVPLNNGDGITFADTYHCTFFLATGFKTYLSSIGLAPK